MTTVTYDTTNEVLSASVPIESGAVLNWAPVHQLELTAAELKTGFLLRAELQCEVTNDTGVNTGVDICVLLSEVQPTPGANVPAGRAVMLIQPCTVDVTPDGGMHHYPFFASATIKLTEDWPNGGFLTSRILAQSTAYATASGPLTIEGSAYGQLTVIVTKG